MIVLVNILTFKCLIMNEITKNTLFISILNEDELNDLKGGVAMILKAVDKPEESGDGAQYVCCIDINL